MQARDRFFRSACHSAVVLGLLTVCAVALAQAPAAKRIVADVIPQGNHRVPSEKITGLLKTRPGDEFNQSVVEDDVRRLVETGWFTKFGVQVRTEDTPDGKVLVTFAVIEPPNTIQEIVYLGAKHLKPADLDAVTGLKKGAILSPVANQMAKQAILRKYHEKGRLLASVDH